MSKHDPFWWLREGGAGSGNFSHAGRPGERGGSAPGGVAADALRSIRANGGVTINVHGEVPTDGFAVAGMGTEEVFHRDITGADVRNYFRAHADILNRPRYYFGAWVADDGAVYFDTPEVIKDRKEALQVAHNRNEISIFDLSTVGTDKDGTIYTMSDHKRPSDSSGMREARAPGNATLVVFGKDRTPDEIAAAVNAVRRAKREKTKGAD